MTLETFSVSSGAGNDFRVQIRALAADAVGGVFGVISDEQGYPRREGAARVLRTLLETRGAMIQSELIQAAADLAAPHLAGDPGLRSRIASVLEVLVLAGDVARAPGLAGGLCWALPLRYVNVGGGRAAALGTAALTSDAELVGESIVRTVDTRPDAAGLAVFLGAPTFRSEQAAGEVSPDQNSSLLEFLAAALARAKSSSESADPNARLVEDDLPGGASLWKTEDRIFLVATGENGPRATPLSSRDAAQWLSLAARLEAGLGRLADGPLGLPAQMRMAAALAGTPQDDGLKSWLLPDYFQQTLRTWLGEPPTPIEVERPPETDDEQDRIVSAAPDARLIVEAGPGSGKTRVAIERIRSLIESDVSPTRIWVVSFTHAATGELRRRIAAALEEPRPALELTISTLDALAARLRRYGTDEEAHGDYDTAIAETVRLIETDDAQLIGFLQRLEHVIVDEVQDLTAARSALLVAIIRRLRPSCGVTLLQDSAQAIYGFADVGQAPSRPVASVLLEDDRLKFSLRTLQHDHRTQNPELREMKRRLRATLLDGAMTPEARYAGVRSEIERTTPPVRGAIEDRLPSTSSIILFRSRIDLVAAAARYWNRGRSFRLRLPRAEPVLSSWIGAVLGSAPGDDLTRSDFEHLWEETWPAPLGLSSERAFAILQSFSGAGDGLRLDLANLAREYVSGRAPPSAATQSILGRTGALLSTVHAVKGLEAEHVVMVLPRTPGSATGEPLLEEARVLFVAATRPRMTLEVTGAADIHARRLPGGRRWSSRPDGHAVVEIGLEGDVEVSDGNTEEAEARRARLWSNADRVVPLTAVRGEGGYELMGAGGAARGESFGQLSAQALADFKVIGRALHPDGASPGRTIRGLWLAGVRTTIAFDADTPSGASARFGLAPIVVGLPTVYFNPFEARPTSASEAP